MKNFTVQKLIDLAEDNWPEYKRDVDLVALYIYRVSDELKELAGREIDDYGIQMGEFDALATLRLSAPPYQLSPTEIYTELLISSGGLTKILNRLESKKMIRRVENKKDRRSSLVRLTAKGVKTIESSMSRVATAEKAFLSSISIAKHEEFLRLLTSLPEDIPD